MIAEAILKKARCPECGAMVIPWERFPITLEPLVTCSFGVQTYIDKERFRNQIAEMEAEQQEAINEQENDRIEEREREKADDTPEDEPGDNYDGPEEAQEWEDYEGPELPSEESE
jgi:hypothetical protein